MPCKRKKKLQTKKLPPPYLLVLYDFDPLTAESILDEDTTLCAPDVNHQLPATRGDKLAVISEELDWWMKCRSLRTEECGYIPSIICSPVCEVPVEER